jgi:hypothetical protein
VLPSFRLKVERRINLLTMETRCVETRGVVEDSRPLLHTILKKNEAKFFWSAVLSSATKTRVQKYQCIVVERLYISGMHLRMHKIRP